MIIKEYTKIIKIHPVLLKKQDVQKIVSNITEHAEDEKVNFEFQIGYGSEKISYHSLDEMNSFNSELKSDDLSLKATISKNNEIIKSISIRFYHNFADYQIHSNDEAWFLGKQEQINKILHDRRPWYWVVKKVFPFFFAPLIMIGLLLGLLGIKNNNLYSVLIGIIIFSLSVIIAIFESRQALFPYIKIVFNEKNEKKFFTYELFTAIMTLLTFTLGVIDFFYNIKK